MRKPTTACPRRRSVTANGWVDVITINEVGDHLGEDLADRLAQAQKDDDPPLGVVLDLRGNGGGSTDGAAAAIGLFLPGVPSFPLIHRGVVSEILRASAPDAEAVWKGPVAVLVDGYTASAAEMIAGAIDSYGRGPLLGAHTFGKGCVQEYFDDHSGAGVLRLTTLLVALPDGSALCSRWGSSPSGRSACRRSTSTRPIWKGLPKGFPGRTFEIGPRWAPFPGLRPADVSVRAKIRWFVGPWPGSAPVPGCRSGVAGREFRFLRTRAARPARRLC